MSNVAIVYQVLTQEGGLSPVQAAGLIGRFQQESGRDLNPQAVGDRSIPGASVGIGQWNRDRQQNLKAFAGDRWTDPAMQARFALHEMGIGGDPSKPGYGAESMAGRHLRNAATIQDAAIAGMHYERPMGYTAQQPTAGHGYRNTVNNAQAIFDGGAPSASASSAPTAAPTYDPASGTAQPAGDLTGGAPMPQNPAGTPPKKATTRDKLAKMAAGMGAAISKGTSPGQMSIVPSMGNVISLEGGFAPIDPQQAQRQQVASADTLRRLNTGTLF